MTRARRQGLFSASPAAGIHFKLTEERDEFGEWARTMPSMQVLERDQALTKPACRILSEKFGEKVLRVTDYQGDLAITMDRSVVEAKRPDCATIRTGLQAFLDLCGVDYPTTSRGPIGSRWLFTSWLPTSTTSA